MVITKIWLQSDMRNSEIVPSSNTLIYRGRGSRGEGIIVAIKNVQFTRLDSIDNHESLRCELRFFGKNITLDGVYRPPSAPPECLEALYDYLLQNTDSRWDILLTGDFNLPSINWPNLSHDSKNSRYAESLLLTAFTFSLNQLVSDATSMTSSSVLDLAFASSSLTECSVTLGDGIW